MAKCKWCDKSLPEEEIPVCTSCILYTKSQASPSKDTKVFDTLDSSFANYDLSSLSDTVEEEGSNRSIADVKTALFTQTFYKEHKDLSEILMSKVKIKSNSVRSRQLVLDGVVLAFDENGVAEINESDLSAVEAYSKVHPNRLKVIEEPKEKVSEPVPAPPKPKAAPKKVETKPKVKKEENTESSKEKPSSQKKEDTKEDSE